MGISQEERKQLDEEGYIVIPDVLSKSEIPTYKERLLELAEEERKDGSGIVHSDGKGQHVRWLVNKGEMFEKMVAHPEVMPYFEYLLGEDYTLSTLTSNIISLGAEDGKYHVDNALGKMPEPLPSFPVVANSLWLLEDFSPENGGTRFVPRSHLRLKKPSDELTQDPEEVRLSAAKGSVWIEEVSDLNCFLGMRKI